MVRNQKIQKSIELFAQLIKDRLDDLADSAANVDLEYLDIEIEYLDVPSADEKQTSNGAIVTTKYGYVIILPNYNENSCVAVTYNMRMADAMDMEGFDSKTIDNDGVLYGQLLEHTDANVELLALYLSKKL